VGDRGMGRWVGNTYVETITECDYDCTNGNDIEKVINRNLKKNTRG